MIPSLKQVDDNEIAARQKFCLSILALCCRKPQPLQVAARLGRGSPFHSLGLTVESKPNDAFIGLAVVAFAASVIWYALGLKVVLWVLWIFLFGAVVLHLWSSKSVTARVLAVVLMPAVLLVYLIPKSTKRGIHARGEANEDRK